MDNEIVKNQLIEFKNLLHYKGKINAKQNVEIQNNLLDILKVNEAKNITNTTINVTHKVELIDGNQVIDTELFIPLDKPILNFNNHEGFDYISKLSVENALKLNFIGNQQDLQFSVQRMINHLSDNKITPKTSLFTVTIIDQEVIDSKGSLIKGYLFIGI